ncbi:MAG: hypothetical protein ACYDAR_20490 [Thermomicrobiales bacterium]
MSISVAGHALIPIRRHDGSLIYTFSVHGTLYGVKPHRHRTGYTLHNRMYDWLELFATLGEAITYVDQFEDPHGSRGEWDWSRMDDPAAAHDPAQVSRREMYHDNPLCDAYPARD